MPGAWVRSLGQGCGGSKSYRPQGMVPPTLPKKKKKEKRIALQNGETQSGVQRSQGQGLVGNK